MLKRISRWWQVKQQAKKKTRRPLENVRAQGLEDLLNGSGREFAQESESPDLGNRPEAAGSEATDVQLMQEVLGSFRLLCYGQGDIPHLWQGPGEVESALVNNAIQNMKPQVVHTSQTSSHKTATPPEKLVSMEAGRKYRVHTPQTGNETSAGSEETDISALSRELWRGLDNRIKRQRNL